MASYNLPCSFYLPLIQRGRLISLRSLHRAPLYIPPKRRKQSQSYRICPQKAKQKKKEKEDKWESESCVTVLHAAEKERGWTSEPLREASELWSGMWGGNWWPYFSGCASASTSFWEQNRWTGTQIWNLISGYNDALMQCVCVCEGERQRESVCVLFTVIALAPFSLQHLYRPHILLQLDLQDLVLPTQTHRKRQLSRAGCLNFGGNALLAGISVKMPNILAVRWYLGFGIPVNIVKLKSAAAPIIVSWQKNDRKNSNYQYIVSEIN